MLTIIDKTRSYIHLETETGVQFIHFLSLRAFDKNLNGYNENYCWSGFCKGAFQFIQDEDFSLFVEYKDGTTYNGDHEVKSIRIPAIQNAVVGNASGEEFYGDAWKITYDTFYDCYFLREKGENCDNEVDAYVDGVILPH